MMTAVKQFIRGGMSMRSPLIFGTLCVALITSGCSKWNDYKEGGYLDDHWGWVETSGQYEVDWVARMIGLLGVEEGELEGWMVTKDDEGHVLSIVRFHRSRPTGEARYYNRDMTLRVIGQCDDRGYLSSFVVVDTDTVMTYRSKDNSIRLLKEGKLIGTHYPRRRVKIWGSSTPPVIPIDSGYVIVDTHGELVVRLRSPSHQ